MNSVDLTALRVVAVKHVEQAAARGAKEIVTRKGAVVTPLAREVIERRSIAVRELAHDIQNNWYVVRK